jgi:hypothetical protein
MRRAGFANEFSQFTPGADCVSLPTMSMRKQAPVKSNPSEQEIAMRAYHVWEAAGRPHGQAVEHWLAAEAQLRAADDARQRSNRYGLVLKS